MQDKLKGSPENTCRKSHYICQLKHESNLSFWVVSNLLFILDKVGSFKDSL